MLILKRNFCHKLNAFNLKLKFNPKIKFDNFYSDMMQNIRTSQDITSNKLKDLIAENGLDKTAEEVQYLSYIAKLNQNKEDTLRIMKDPSIDLYNQKHSETQMKFMMPIGWGWTLPFVNYTSMMLVSLKVATGIPWLPYFIFVAFGVRFMMMPLMVRQMVLVHRMAKVSPNIRLLAYCMKKCDLPLMTKGYYFTRALFRYSKEAKVNLFTFAAYNVFQIPIFFLMVFSIRKISYEQNLNDTGVLWFKNLNEPDPYMILPVCSVLLMYFNIGRGIDKNNEHWLINRWRSYFQVIQFVLLPFSCYWPAGAHVYWISSLLFSVFQISLFRHPRVLAKINPTFFNDMQRVFKTERSREDSERYIEKLKKCEDPVIKSPTTFMNALYEFRYERSRMLIYLKSLKYKKKLRSIKSIFGRDRITSDDKK